MLLNKIKIKNYRNYMDTEINFNDEINIIVGANNSGKTNILHIISLLSTEIKLTVEDFNKNLLYKDFKTYKEISPVIQIEYFVKHSMSYETLNSGFSRLEKFIIYDENGDISSSDKDFFDVNAIIIIKYELDPKYENEYKKSMNNVNSYEEFTHILAKYEQYYQINYYNSVSNEKIEMRNDKNLFNIEVINANRNIDEITSNTKKYVKSKMSDNKEDIDCLNSDINSSIKTRLNPITDSINEEIQKDQENIGVSNGKNDFIATFEFNSDFTEFFKFELNNATIGYNLPLDNNGLGYNNLIYIRNSINFKNENEFNLLLIEEPEAHLHPNMQYKLINYIKAYNTNSKNSNQVFITTHSSNITASANIDDIILVDYVCTTDKQNVKCINLKDNFNSEIIKEKFKIDIKQDELTKNKEHLHKFLDVTRSDLLFADSVILVEGLSEKIFIPHAYLKKYGENLVDKYVSIIEVGGITFKNFLPLFLGTSKKVLCISDVDYVYSDSSSFNDETFKKEAGNKLNNMGKVYYGNQLNYLFCTQKLGGSTFEKELFLQNYEKNAEELLFFVFPKNDFKSKISEGNKISQLKTFDFWNNEAGKIINDNRIWKSVENLLSYYNNIKNNLTDTTKINSLIKHFLCELFYKYIQNKKGDFALRISFEKWVECPSYISEGLEWLKK